jgi:hypothetical protein
VQDTHDIVPNDLLRKIHRAVLRKLSEIQSHRSKQTEWGLLQMKHAMKRWQDGKNDATKDTLLANPFFAELVEIAARV